MATDEPPSDDSLAGKQTSIWMDTSPGTDYDELEDGLRVDTAVVGGGIVGITTAYELLQAGQSVAVVDRARIIAGVTGHTTAKLTSLHGLVYDHLVSNVGEAEAQHYADANEAAIDTVESNAETLDIDSEFERAPAYTYTDSAERRSDIRDEVEAARLLGLPASYTESTELPFDVNAAVRFDQQGLFHPRKYLLGLAREVAANDDCHLFERTRATGLDDGSPCRVETDRGELVADDVVVATHFPVFDHGLYFARLYPKRSYVLAVTLQEDAPDGMYYRPDEPYFSVRPVPSADEPTVLIGGQNHRTGEGGSTADRYRRLQRQAMDRFDVASIEYRWSTQDYVSVDRVPFVGPLAPQLRNVYVATGFGGWGLTNGTAAGTILSDMVRGRENPWRDVYRPTRFQIEGSMTDFLRHNAHSTKEYAKKYLEKLVPEGTEVGPGEGRVVESDDGPVALSRDEDGEFHAVSAVCSHMGCLVEWNDGERSWDCPCHGSRYDQYGRVLETPAVDDLEPVIDLDLKSLDVEVDTPESME